MAVAPAVTKKKSAAQVAAGKKFAAAGRAAQAKLHRKRSAAQHAQSVKAAAAGRASQAQTRAAAKAGKKVPVKPVKRAAAAPAELVIPGTGWLCNGPAPSCAAIAVANSLLSATGICTTREEIELLHALAGGDNGAVIEDVLAAASEHGHLLGHGKARLQAYVPADLSVIVAGLVVGIALPHAGHTVLTVLGGMISWGLLLPFDGEPQEAWALEWTAPNVYGGV